ncbi:ATP synthase subunit I [Pleionea sp. CnH1-48]|uniref:ATP synthase subunit I n=1 Tax=Pleionea sp. CnH1-48 TaxID=2954494 RepID=UPI002097B443|nr:ATP synthase subunit I [Pleionea sp. CnH1-48]MCO7226608.1 ATP synthase subunit I [Pleionea sp. CnH1-48]
MANSISVGGRKLALKIIATQAIFVLIASVIALSWGLWSSASVLIGGLTCVLPSLVFTHFAFKHSGARASRQVLRGFYLGEALKLVLTILMFIAAFQWFPIEVGPLFLGFGLALLLQWVAPFVLTTSKKG